MLKGIAISLVVAAAAGTADHSAPILLDDADATRQGLKVGTFEHCLRDAHGGGFHQGKTAVKEASASSAAYTFEPAVDGCYVLEEWHPGSDGLCSHYLSDAVRLDVKYCKGKSAYTFLDQSQNGGQWNVLGALPFYKGWRGEITAKSNGTAGSCLQHARDGSPCIWVADAFRVTRVSDLKKGCRVPPDFSSKDAASSTTPMPALASTASTQTILDDAHAEVHAWMVHDAFTESPSSFTCGKQGWHQRFLYLDPTLAESSEAPVDFVFAPPEDGCYLVEEFHPVGCSRSLSAEVQLTIAYCKKKTMRLTLDQTQFGNRWNTVALLPFYKGMNGKITVKHPQVGGGVVTADAFRLTRVSGSCAQAPLKLVEYARLVQHPVSVTLDEVRAVKTGTGATACDSTALDGSAHAVAKGSASAKFMFLPPSTGCYRVDEFHPASGEACPLAASAGVTINYCLGQSWKGTASLSSGGEKWNTVGHFPFYAGVIGNITSRRLSSSLPGKYWVADAFRLTKVSDSCYRVPYSAEIGLRVVGVDLASSGLPDGELTTRADLRIAFHEAVVEATRLSSSAVRLIGLRRGSIIAEFEFSGRQDLVSEGVARLRADLAQAAGSPLRAALCAAAIVGADARAPCSVELSIGGVHVPPAAAAGGDEESQSALPIVLVALGAAVLLLSAAAFAVFWRSRRRQSQSASAAAIAEAVKDKDSKDDVSECGSTATPASEKVTSEVQTELSGDAFSDTASQRENTLEAGGDDLHTEACDTAKIPDDSSDKINGIV